MNGILITGATGNLGRAATKALLARGFSVKAAIRNPAKFTPTAGVEVVKFDYVERGTHEAALRGAEGLVLIAPPLDPDAPAKLNPVIDDAKSAGVKQIVFASAFGVDALEQAPLRQVELHLMASGVAYTIVRPNFFMENFSTGFLARMVKTGSIILAAGEGKTSFISVGNIAEVMAAAFLKGLSGKAYNLTGPEALDHAAAASIIAEVSGKLVAYHAIPQDEMLQGLRDNGLPESAVQYIGVLYGAVRADYMAGVTNDVEAVTGRSPINFETFARESAGAWA